MADAQDDGLDPHRCVHIAVVGKKRSGKTELAWLLFDSYPYDRLVIDPNGDLKVGPDVEELVAPIPTRWPSWPQEAEGRPPKRRTFRYVPDFGDPAVYEDIDRAVGLAYGHPRTMLFIDECHEAAPAAQMQRRPHMRRALRQGRHRRLSMILATPRPMTVDPLVISQADLTYVFKLPQPADRKRVADCIGYDVGDFDAAVHDLAKHEYLCYDAEEDDLAHYPPLPPGMIVGHMAA